MDIAPQNVKALCHHCGEGCSDIKYQRDNLVFCCNGCRLVYCILSDAKLLNYYKISSSPGSSIPFTKKQDYSFLDDSDVIDALLDFAYGNTAKVKFEIPHIHCSSCLYLLENLTKLDPNVSSSIVNFIKKEVSITFNYSQLSLRALVELLNRIGYQPLLTNESISDNKVSIGPQRKLYYQLGLAGFSFANIMLLSFPDYLGLQHASSYLFIGYINILLATPVLLFCARDYLVSAWTSIYYTRPNIDVPIAIGVITLFARSVFEIIAGVGEGYLDSFTGFIFFLIIGKWFQGFTYEALDFDRTYTSYFPISSMILNKGKWISMPIDKLKKDDIILVRNEEIIATDGVLLSDSADIDYSFVTGESTLVQKLKGQKVFAGGKQRGQSIQIKVTHKSKKSKLVQLWSEAVFKSRHETNASVIVDVVSRYFTYSILSIALCTLVYWLYVDISLAFNAVTAVLIVACPCALALAVPFTYGSMLRYLAARGLYLRNTNTIENIQSIDTIIFDKTGTLTNNKLTQVDYKGKSLSHQQKQLIRSASLQSKHPLSVAITRQLENIDPIGIDYFEEIVGSGSIAKAQGQVLRLGSERFIFGSQDNYDNRGVCIEINDKYIGSYVYNYSERSGLKDLISTLQKKYKIAVLSGDNNAMKHKFETLFNYKSEIAFDQSPKDKLFFIKDLQSKDRQVMMVGDGLNDAGALKQSNVGIAITESNNNFSPACDGVLQANNFKDLGDFIRYIYHAKYIIYGAFMLALVYNCVGLYFAVTAQLSPIVAAILMPISSISIIIYGSVTTYLLSKIMLRNQNGES